MILIRTHDLFSYFSMVHLFCFLRFNQMYENNDLGQKTKNGNFLLWRRIFNSNFLNDSNCGSNLRSLFKFFLLLFANKHSASMISYLKTMTGCQAEWAFCLSTQRSFNTMFLIFKLGLSDFIFNQFNV